MSVLRRTVRTEPVRTLTVERADIGYGQMTVLRGVCFTVGTGECVGVLGPNGAGKTTLLSCLAGVLGVGSGTVTGDGRDLTRVGPEARRAAGVSLVPEGRRIFPRLTVEETLLFANEALRLPRPEVAAAVAAAYDRFPSLARRKHVAAGMLSGGEQQMLSLARAMAGDPSVLLVDEPFMGLAPPVVHELVATFRDLCASGLTMVLADESATALALMAPDRVVDVRDLQLAPAGSAA